MCACEVTGWKTRETLECVESLKVTVPPTCRKGVQRGTDAVIASSWMSPETVCHTSYYTTKKRKRQRPAYEIKPFPFTLARYTQQKIKRKIRVMKKWRAFKTYPFSQWSKASLQFWRSISQAFDVSGMLSSCSALSITWQWCVHECLWEGDNIIMKTC